MKRLTIILLTATIALASYADNWCEKLTKQLNSTAGIDKTIKVERNPKSKKLVSGVYDYKFASARISRTIKKELLSHIEEADYFSDTGNETLLMRLTIDGMRWDCKLQYAPQGGQFLVNVIQADKHNEPMPLKPETQSHHSSVSQQISHTQTDKDKAAIEQNNRELEKAERERREKLGR